MKSGRYRHYKGNEYVVIGVARHSETDEELVVYGPTTVSKDCGCDRKRCFWRPSKLMVSRCLGFSPLIPKVNRRGYGGEIALDVSCGNRLIC